MVLQTAAILQMDPQHLRSLDHDYIRQTHTLVSESRVTWLTGNLQCRAEMFGELYAVPEEVNGVKGTRIGLSLYFDASTFVSTQDHAEINIHEPGGIVHIPRRQPQEIAWRESGRIY